MHRSSLASELDQLGAQWVELGDWEVVAEYGDFEKEYRSATESLVVRDASHFGRLEASGKDHIDLIHRLTTNELRNLQPGQGQINIFTNEKGRIVERVILLKFADHLLLVTSPGNSAKLIAWLDRFTFIEEFHVRDRTFETAALQLIGPDSPGLLQQRLGTPVDSLPHWHFLEAEAEGESLIVVHLGDLQVPSFLVLGEAAGIRAIWQALRADGVQPLGESAYDILRVESGWGAYGRELSESTNPLEAGQMPFVSFTKGCYIGQEVVARLDTYDKVQRVLVGFELEAAVPEGSGVYVDDSEIGLVTSVVYSVSLGKPVALGYVRRKWAEPGTDVLVKSQDTEVAARIVGLPFFGGSEQKT